MKMQFDFNVTIDVAKTITAIAVLIATLHHIGMFN